MIIPWIKNLEVASDARSAAQKKLDNDELTPAAQKKLADEVSKFNKQIETYAKRINDDLRQAARDRLKIDSAKSLDTIKDGALKDYCSSVAKTIANLNQQIQAEGWRAGQYAQSLANKRADAVKLERTAKQNQTTLANEDAKLARRESDLKKRLTDREQDLKKIETEQKRLDGEKGKFDAECARAKAAEGQKRRELEKLQTQAESLAADIKREPLRDNRDKLREKLARIEPQIQQLDELVNRQMAFQIDQFNQIDAKIDFERTQLDQATVSAKTDIAALKREVQETGKVRAAIKANIVREQKRQAAITALIADCDRAADHAKEYGVGARG